MSIRLGQRLCHILAAVGMCGAGWIGTASAKDGAWYLGGGFGGMAVQDQTVGIPQGRLEDSFFLLNRDYGYDTSLFVGYDLGAFRIEAEVAYKQAEIRGTAPATGGPRIFAAGSNSALSFMVNGL